MADSLQAAIEELCVDESFLEEKDEYSVSNLEEIIERYNYIMQKAEDALTNTTAGVGGEGELIVECNSLLSVDIDKEIAAIHNLIRDKYRSKFPELESLVHDPIDYARLVKKIGNGTDLSLVDLQGLVAPAILIAVVSITAISTGKRPLSEQELQETVDACDRVVALDGAKMTLLEVIERQMGCIAPNLSGVVGAGVAARLMAAAGGLSALVNMPACNVQLLDAKRTALAGFSSRLGVGVGGGYLQQTDIFRTTPPSLRMRACRLLAAKSTLASRVDFMKADPTGNTGKRMRHEIVNKIDKWQEPPPARHPKPLRLPAGSQPRKKRGGIRLQKAKRRYGLTEMRKLANRMAFGVPEDSSLGDGYGQGHGMLTSKLRVKVANKFNLKKSCQYAAAAAASTLAFTPVQGIELCDPQPLGATATAHHTYFSQTAAFSKINTTT